MKKREPSLKLYTTLLKLYPESFRKEYEEQLLLTAADILVESKSNTAATFATIRLCFDTFGSAIKAQYAAHSDILRPQLHGTTPRSVFRSLMFAIEIVLITIVSLLWVSMFNSTLSSMTRYSHVPDFTLSTLFYAVITGLSLLTYLPLALIVLKRSTTLSIWKTVRWGYVLGVAGTVGSTLFGTVIYRLFFGTVIYQLFISTSIVIDLLIFVTYTTLFYLAATRIAKKLDRRQLPAIS